MQRFRAFLDERNPGELGAGAEPQLDHIVAPVLADAGIALDECGAAVSTGDHEAARVQRAAGVVIGQMDDLDRPLEDDTGRDIEHKAIGEKRCIERCERPVQRLRIEPGAYQIRPLGDGRCHRPEPHARRKPIEPRQLRRKTAIDEHEPMCRFGQPDFRELRAHGGCDGGGPTPDRQHRPLLEPVQIEITPSLAAPRRKPQLGEAGKAAVAIAREPVRITLVAGAPERFEIRSRLGLDREIDDGAHRGCSRFLRPRLRRRHSRAAPAPGRGSCRPTGRCGRLAARAPDPARHSRASAGSG